jgi:hypothetical protein
MRLLKQLLLVLTPIGAAAFLAGGGTFGSFDELAAWRRAPKLARATTAAVADGHGLYSAKKILLALMAVGAAAFFLGGGTFASFSAETSNPDTIASGTLTMTNTVNGGTTCYSYNGVGNVNPNCSAALTLGNLSPGTFGGTTTSGVAVSGSSQVVVTNTGSIDAAKFYLYAPQVTGTASAAITDNATASAPISGTVPIGATSITLTAGLANALSLGTQVTLSGTSETVTLTADAAQSATTLSVTPTQFAHANPNTVTYPIPFNIPVNALNTAIGAGQEVIVKQSTHSDIFQADTAASVGAVNVHVAAPLTPPSFTTYTGNAGGTGASISTIDCYDSRTTVGGITGADSGTNVKGFDTTASNPLCGALLMSVQEVETGGQTYCWSGNGSSPESPLGMCAAPVSTNLATPVNSGSTVNSLPLGALNGNIRSGDTLTVTEGANSQSFTVSYDATDTVGSAGSLVNATTLPLTSQLGHALPAGTVVTVGSGGSADTVTTNAAVLATATSLTFTSGMPHAHSSGETVGYSYPGGANDRFYSGAQSIPVSGGQTANATYSTSATVVDTTELNTLNGDQSNTVSNFDTLHPSSGEVLLYPPNGYGTLNTTAPVWLGHSGSSNSTRTFYVSVYMPKPSGSNQNVLQGLSSTFGLTWHIDQL